MRTIAVDRGNLWVNMRYNHPTSIILRYGRMGSKWRKRFGDFFRLFRCWLT